ncbi:MobF family relaxase, partial [Sphingobium fuliginis]|uniref:MobF family relaxase n=2 Tax=Sphingobium TaxID=165695 RepID=UPI0037C8D0FA
MINPVRLYGKPGNVARYYALGDYYKKGPDEHSEWGGAIARDLGLEGKVDSRIFEQLLSGRVGEQQLGRHRGGGEIEHHPGWDFAVSAPKSVSIMALVAGDERILAAHEKSVGTALNYLEEHAALRRRVEGEIVHETTGRLIFARFTEHASRELDPHLHTHVVVMNITGRDGDAQMASLETRAMFSEQMTAGQVYRNDLAHGLRELGYAIDHDPRTGLFEIKGVPQDLVKAFSQRAEQIDAHAREEGLTGQAGRQASFYATRPHKQKIGIEALREQWQQRSERYREGLDLLSRKESREIVPRAADVGRAALFGMRQAESREAVNNLGRIFRLGLASHVGEVRLSDVRPIIEVHEARRKLLATREQTGDRILTRGRTTRKTARLEQALTQHLALALNDARPIASADRLLDALGKAGLTPAQEQALVAVAISRDRVNGIHGVAGSGKSTLVKTLKEAAEPETILIATAPTSSATLKLGQDAGIESRTVASLLAGGGHGISDRHVLVLDEAGQLGNRQAARVLEISRKTGARLLLLGDDHQTGAIEQGKAFWLLQRLGLPTAELKESVRQETRSMKAAVTYAREGDYPASIAALDKVVSGESVDILAKDMVREWTRLKPEHRDSTNILVLENATRLAVNAQIREALKKEGGIAIEESRLQILSPAGMSDEEKRFARFYSGGQVVKFGRDIAEIGIVRDAEYRVAGLGRNENGRQIVRLTDEQGRVIRWDPRSTRPRQVNIFEQGERDLAAGDRVQWRLANKELDLKNAERGTVEKLDGSFATIRWDREARIQTVDLSMHKT